MKYVSTRGNSPAVTSAEAIKTGLAADGGLYMPESIPAFTEESLRALAPLSYPERAARVLSMFLSDYSYEELLRDAEGAYSASKFIPAPAPVSDLGDGMYMLELWHGPTSAFKDMALQIMPRLFSRALKKTGEERTALILVATSGDTGKAALEGYCDVPGTKIKVFYPQNGVSRVQKLQMQTQVGKNVSVSAIVGNFDDAQNGVKRIFGSDKMREELNDAGVFLSSANSINWGRLVPQIVYYVSAYCDLFSTGKIAFGEKIDVTVPTGNFGNIFAAFIAKKMGVPIDRLICASNKNNVLTEFLETGTYDRNREFHATMSPSMDILISSNLERLLFLVAGPERTANYMKELAENGKYTVDKADFANICSHFSGYYTDEDKTGETIKCIYEKKNCLIDTHTAVALSASYRYTNDNKAERKILTVSTASPYKFASDVYASLVSNKPSDDIAALELLRDLTGVSIPYPLADIAKRTVIHTDIIERDAMDDSVKNFAGC